MVSAGDEFRPGRDGSLLEMLEVKGKAFYKSCLALQKTIAIFDKVEAAQPTSLIRAEPGQCALTAFI